MRDIGIASMVIITLEVLKRFNIDKRVIPLLSLAFAMLYTSLYQGFNLVSIQEGMILGATACGIYSGGLTIIDGDKKDTEINDTEDTEKHVLDYYDGYDR